MKKAKFVAAILSVLILIQSVFLGGAVASAEGINGFASGAGTAESPYSITTKEQLANVINYTSSNFRLDANITLTVEDYGTNGLFNFSGITINGINNTFCGVFDGNNHTISGVKLYQMSSGSFYTYSAFPFFHENCGTIKNLTLGLNGVATKELNAYSADNGKYIFFGGITYENPGTISNCHITGNLEFENSYSCLYSGGIAYKNIGTICNCTCEAKFEFINDSYYDEIYVGGIAGKNQNKITCCGSNAAISVLGKLNEGDACIGGIAGYNSCSVAGSNCIDQCYFCGDIAVQLPYYLKYINVLIGGIAGVDYDNDAKPSTTSNIRNCFYNGTCSLIDLTTNDCGNSSYSIGGITSYAMHMSSDHQDVDAPLISNCYSAGTIESCFIDKTVDIHSGQLLSNLADGQYVTNCYSYSKTMLPFGDSEGTASKTFDQMKLKETYAGFDFDNTWEFGTNDNYFYPTLKNVAYNFIPKPIGVYVESHPETINTTDIRNMDLSGFVVKRIMNNGNVENTNQFILCSAYGQLHYGENSLVAVYDDGTYFYYSDPFTINISSDIVPPCSVSYNTHVQDIGWMGYVSDGQDSGTTGQSKRLEGIHIKIDGDSNLGVEYATHVQDIGWQDFVADNEMSGTEGQCKRLEAIKIKLTGIDAELYDIYYRVHAQDYGWLGWAKNGDAAGTEGLSKRLEAIEIRIVKKTENPNLDTSNPFVSVYGNGLISYRTHVQNFGWQNYVSDGAMSGTQGQSLRLEGINIRLNTNLQGDIYYMTHVQDIGWMDPVSNNQLSGTQGQSKRLEAIAIALDGEVAEQYDIYYRVHAQNVGWMGWAKNGQLAGTEGFSYRLEGIQIVMVPKGGAAPGDTNNAFLSNYNYY